MRQKQPRCIITFHTTVGAMAMEKMCRDQALPGRLIPVPREILAGCGMAWSAPPEARASLEAAIRARGLDAENYYELVI